jgi:hypothetical protein
LKGFLFQTDIYQVNRLGKYIRFMVNENLRDQAATAYARINNALLSQTAQSEYS